LLSGLLLCRLLLGFLGSGLLHHLLFTLFRCRFLSRLLLDSFLPGFFGGCLLLCSFLLGFFCGR
jgi:hypothetical protein